MTDEIKATVRWLLLGQTLLGMVIGVGITALVFLSDEETDHYPKYTERLEQCEALLGKSINLTTECVNARTKEQCKEDNVR